MILLKEVEGISQMDVYQIYSYELNRKNPWRWLIKSHHLGNLKRFSISLVSAQI